MYQEEIDIHSAIYDGDLNKVKEYLRRGGDIEKKKNDYVMN